MLRKYPRLRGCVRPGYLVRPPGKMESTAVTSLGGGRYAATLFNLNHGPTPLSRGWAVLKERSRTRVSVLSQLSPRPSFPP